MAKVVDAQRVAKVVLADVEVDGAEVRLVGRVVDFEVACLVAVYLQFDIVGAVCMRFEQAALEALEQLADLPFAALLDDCLGAIDEVGIRVVVDEDLCFFCEEQAVVVDSHSLGRESVEGVVGHEPLCYEP